MSGSHSPTSYASLPRRATSWDLGCVVETVHGVSIVAPELQWDAADEVDEPSLPRAVSTMTSWYRDDVSYEECEVELSIRPAGAFVIIPVAANKEQLVYKYEGKCLSRLIEADQLKGVRLQDSRRWYPNLPSLVNFYSSSDAAVLHDLHVRLKLPGSNRDLHSSLRERKGSNGSTFTPSTIRPYEPEEPHLRPDQVRHYAGKVSRADAINWLGAPRKDLEFVIHRPLGNPSKYVICYVHSVSGVSVSEVDVNAQGELVPQGAAEGFIDVSALIDHLKDANRSRSHSGTGSSSAHVLREDHLGESWFFVNYSQQQAKQGLLGAPVGSFVVRQRPQILPVSYGLDYMGRERIHHRRILHTSKGLHLKDTADYFDSLRDLIHAYSRDLNLNGVHLVLPKDNARWQPPKNNKKPQSSLSGSLKALKRSRERPGAAAPSGDANHRGRGPATVAEVSEALASKLDGDKDRSRQTNGVRHTNGGHTKPVGENGHRDRDGEGEAPDSETESSDGSEDVPNFPLSKGGSQHSSAPNLAAEDMMAEAQTRLEHFERFSASNPDLSKAGAERTAHTPVHSRSQQLKSELLTRKLSAIALQRETEAGIERKTKPSSILRRARNFAWCQIGVWPTERAIAQLINQPTGCFIVRSKTGHEQWDPIERSIAFVLSYVHNGMIENEDIIVIPGSHSPPGARVLRPALWMALPLGHGRTTMFIDPTTLAFFLRDYGRQHPSFPSLHALLTYHMLHRGVLRCVLHLPSHSLAGSEQLDWCQIGLRKAHALEPLLYAPTGAFIVRSSESMPENLVLSFVYDGQIFHELINVNLGSSRYPSSFSLAVVGNHTFRNVQALVDFFTRTPIEFLTPLQFPETWNYVPAPAADQGGPIGGPMGRAGHRHARRVAFSGQRPEPRSRSSGTSLSGFEVKTRRPFWSQGATPPMPRSETASAHHTGRASASPLPYRRHTPASGRTSAGTSGLGSQNGDPPLPRRYFAAAGGGGGGGPVHGMGREPPAHARAQRMPRQVPHQQPVQQPQPAGAPRHRGSRLLSPEPARRSAPSTHRWADQRQRGWQPAARPRAPPLSRSPKPTRRGVHEPVGSQQLLSPPAVRRHPAQPAPPQTRSPRQVRSRFVPREARQFLSPPAARRQPPLHQRMAPNPANAGRQAGYPGGPQRGYRAVPLRARSRPESTLHGSLPPRPEINHHHARYQHQHQHHQYHQYQPQPQPQPQHHHQRQPVPLHRRGPQRQDQDTVLRPAGRPAPALLDARARRAPWCRLDLPRRQALKLLRLGVVGDFVVYAPMHREDLAMLSFICSNGEVGTASLDEHRGGLRLGKSQFTFRTLSHLVLHYRMDDANELPNPLCL